MLTLGRDDEDERTLGPVIVFDTDCVLCSGMVGFVLRHEAAPAFSFVSAWSPTGLALAARHGFSKADLDETFLVLVGATAYRSSDAGVEVLRRLEAPWRWLTILRFVPRWLRDRVYLEVARRRYRWFGHAPRCFTPPPEQLSRFPDLTGRSPRGA